MLFFPEIEYEGKEPECIVSDKLVLISISNIKKGDLTQLMAELRGLADKIAENDFNSCTKII
ncbi:hypothetical protein GWK48_06040 [Metallosphaera tengchongensis]|uniref:Uncharacterized protein n=1 Tax=Metallosphaera tengchongensis TaxID=1532350 RepID=A0A6N0NWI9_9CREN|nr:hypothetical protein [Metallosphaera tengchongensis]QKQ99998.1 hypothetical protein GWK48_06040 [Metallosphaera tengchongensis]